MQKRIFLNFTGLILVCVMLLAVSFSVLFFRSTQTHEMATIRDKAHLVAGLLNQGSYAYAEALNGGETRMTIVSSEGWVLSDSHAGADLAVNRADRMEFSIALTYGSGEAIRRSDTLGAETFYYAILLENGSVLRLSRTLYSLGEVFMSTLPWLIAVMVVILVLAHFIVHRLTKNIIQPLTVVDFESTDTGEPLYEELLPYVKKIELQKQEISNQILALRKAETQRREFSANVSHELKTPLTTISALAEMIANGMVNAEDVSDFASKISSRSHRLINIIEDIIRLSEFDESKVSKDFTTFDIHELAKQVIDSLQEKAAEKKVAVKLTGQPLQVQANSRLLEELMTNLIDNGIKYNKVGGSVTINTGEEDGFCKISVSDTGIGISKKHSSRIFERFYRVDSSRSKKTGGTGLGLSIVKHIAEHHNGRAMVDSVINKGTTFICYIPL